MRGGCPIEPLLLPVKPLVCHMIIYIAASKPQNLRLVTFYGESFWFNCDEISLLYVGACSATFGTLQRAMIFA